MISATALATNPLALGVLENLIAAAIGGAMTAGAALAFTRVKNLVSERRFRLGGVYISKFDDTQEGKRIQVLARVKLKQKGRRLEGDSEAFARQPGKERSWRLRAEIFDPCTVLGSYVCTTPAQTGMGTFSLEIRGQALVGYWSGYDSENHIMNFGQYEFFREADVRIRPYTTTDRAAVVRIAAETLGSGYFNSPGEYLDTSTPSRALVILAADKRNKSPLGFAAGRILQDDELDNLYPAGRQQKPLDIREASARGEVGLIQTVAVAINAQGRGVGIRLVAELEQQLGELGASTFVVPAWAVEGKVNIGGVLTALGYERYAELKGFWAKACRNKEFFCPANAGRGCVCDLILYKR